MLIDIANRLRRHRADRGQQARTFARAAAGVDHGHRIVADDEADIGGIALVGLVHHLDIADVDVDARRNFGDRQRRRRIFLLCTAIAEVSDNKMQQRAASKAERNRSARRKPRVGRRTR